MKQSDVTLGATYIVRVSGALVPVHLDAVSPHGGWDATNTRTGRKIRIRTAAKLRRPYAGTYEDNHRAGKHVSNPRALCRLCACSCGHPEMLHTSHASGARPCRHLGCGCSDFERTAQTGAAQ